MEQRKPTRIQAENRERILAAALEVFARDGFRGATIDAIAAVAGMSKPNLLYYFPTKDWIYRTVLEGLLDTWLDPLRAIDPQGEPMEEILRYVRRKLDLARDYPRESRIFANEILHGAPTILPYLEQDLRQLVDQTAQIIQSWSDAGRIADVDPVHLIFSIWSQTQHYADFDVQVRAVLGQDDPYPAAAAHLETLFRRMLTV